jgi:hypothetical protein
MLLRMGMFDAFRKQKKQEPIDIDKDLKAIVEFFKGVNGSLKELAGMYKRYTELRRQFLHLRGAGASESALAKNITEQVRLYNKILKTFELFELDADIASERAKKIAKALKIAAEEYKISQKWLDLVRKDEKWTFDW